MRHVVENALNSGHRPVRIVNGGPAALGWKTAQNKEKRKDSRHDISTAKKTVFHSMGKGLFEIYFHRRNNHAIFHCFGGLTVDIT